jgi:putative peptidoglycan lipid II flippase
VREGGLGRSAGILGLGNVASRAVGLARESVISYFFGSSGELSAFNLAARVPAMIYDLLVGGMLSAALVPVFSDYARRESRAELTRVASAVLSLIGLVTALMVLGIELLAVPLAGILGDFADPHLQAVLARSLRVIAPSIVLFGLSGSITGVLYALQRFSHAAFAGAVFNLGIVITAPLLTGRLGIYSLPIGVVLGSTLQLLVLTSGLKGVRLRLSTAWDHPAVTRIIALYLPIMLGLLVTQFQIIVDGRWASASAPQSVAWMRYATTLIQLPLGLVPVAVSLAALPALSRRATESDWVGFGALFGGGMRLVLVLLLPATAGLFVLAKPVIRLLFEHGSFTPYDTLMTSRALRLYLIGLPFAGVDFLLNYSFYARQNTRTPAAVGVFAVGIYFVTALLLKGPFGFLGLVMADSAKQIGHAAVMLALFAKAPGRPENQRLRRTLGSATLASLLMGVAIWPVSLALESWLPSSVVAETVTLAVAGGVGTILYFGTLRALRVQEAAAITASLRRGLKRSRGEN